MIRPQPPYRATGARFRFPPAVFLLMASGILFLASCSSTSGSSTPSKAPIPAAGPSVSGLGATDTAGQLLTLAFAKGKVVIELDPKAAPNSVERLQRALSQRRADATSQPNILVEQFWPQIEVSTGLLLPDSEPVPQEISATALGLDQTLIETAGEAIDVLQFELAKADKAWKRDGNRPAQYQAWLDEFLTTSVPTKMLGTSRKEINELLGYRYIDDVASRSPTAGAVYLRTISPTENQLALTILLSDRPQLNGRVTVIGRVIEGLEFVRALSNEPVVIQYGKPTKSPVNPPEVVDVRID